MQKGKTLEDTVYLIQQALNNSSETRIFKNKRLRDNAECLREIDILIELLASKMTFTIAIECKDQSRKVNVAQIENFHIKCQAIPAIHKLVFVSTSGYSASAQKKAIFLGIELYNIEQLSIDIVKKWTSILQSMRIEYLPIDARIELSGPIKIGNIALDTMMKSKSNGVETKLSDLIAISLENSVDRLWTELLVLHSTSPETATSQGIKKCLITEIAPGDLFFEYDGSQIFVASIQTNVIAKLLVLPQEIVDASVYRTSSEIITSQASLKIDDNVKVRMIKISENESHVHISIG